MHSRMHTHARIPVHKIRNRTSKKYKHIYHQHTHTLSSAHIGKNKTLAKIHESFKKHREHTIHIKTNRIGFENRIE